MKRDPVTGFEYPFYCVLAYVWNAKAEEYRCESICNVQTYEEALEKVKRTAVDADTMQLEIVEERKDYCEAVAIKVAVEDEPSGFYLYDPRTDELIA